MHEKLYDEVVERLKKPYSQLRVGDPLEANSIYGPLHNPSAVAMYLRAIEAIKAQGGNIIFGGKVNTMKQQICLQTKKHFTVFCFLLLLLL